MFAVGALVVFESGFCFVLFVAIKTLKCLRQNRVFCCGVNGGGHWLNMAFVVVLL